MCRRIHRGRRLEVLPLKLVTIGREELFYKLLIPADGRPASVQEAGLDSASAVICNGQAVILGPVLNVASAEVDGIGVVAYSIHI